MVPIYGINPFGNDTEEIYYAHSIDELPEKLGLDGPPYDVDIKA